MGCLSENTIQELVAGVLSGDMRARAHRHIETCAACRMLVIELARDDDLEAQLSMRTPAAAGPATHIVADRFELVRVLGHGGMGTVYEALDRERGTRVALKTLQHISADGLLRFKTEFRAVQDVHHPNLVALGELIEERGQWWLTMELVEGVSFVSYVWPGGQLEERRLRAAIPQLAAGLSALHAQGLVHRDVKPSNVLVTPAGRVVLLDFGLVAGVAQSESNVVGTPAYMAPEQGLLQAIGPPADWYGVGALLYEALTGFLPFTGAPLQVLVAKQHELPRRPGELANVPGDLDALCMHLLAIDPAARLAGVAALAKLNPDVATLSPPAGPKSLPVFVGRHRELASLADAFAATRKGAEAIMLIEGESGIGKSALVSHFLEELHQRDPAVRVLAGRCYERETVPYKGIDGVIDALARILRKLPEVELTAVLPRRAGLLLYAFPVLGKVAALRALPPDEVADRIELRVRAFTALRELFGRLAERGPLVVWIDDLQWADADSLELLAWVMARPEAPPLLLLLTSRPRREPAGSGTEAAMARMRALSGLRRMELSPLTRDEAVALAERLLAEDPAASTASADLVADEAAGHPLFIDALVQHAAVRLAAQTSLRLSDALWARVAELDPSARQLLALIAVAGWPLSREIVIAAAVLPADDIDPALVRLRRAHLARITDGAGKSIESYHDRVREAVLEHLDPEQRKACHRALAHALQVVIEPPGAPRDPHSPEALTAAQPSSSSGASWGPEAVAVHLQAAGDLEQAAHYMVLAADQAAEALAFDRAARLYREALALQDEIGGTSGPHADARGVLARLAPALANAGRGAEAAAVYFELARRAAAADDGALELRLRGAEQLLRSGHRDDGWRVLTSVCDELDLRPAVTRVGARWRVLWQRAWVRLRGFDSFAKSGPAALRERPLRERLRLEACRVASMFIGLPGEYLTRHQVLALRAGDPRSVGRALTTEINIAMATGSAGSRRIGRLLDALAAVASRCGDPHTLGQEQLMRAEIALAGGQWTRGREHGARAMQIFRDRCLGASTESTVAAIHYCQCLYIMGEYRVLRCELLPLLREAEERGDHFTLAAFQPIALRMVIFKDEPEAVLQEIDRAGSHVRHLSAQLLRVDIELYRGDGAAAYRRLDQDWRRWMALPGARLPFIRAAALSRHGLVALAAYQSGGLDRQLLRAAARDARGLRAMRMPWTHALAQLLDAGTALVTSAHERGREQLERAHAELIDAGMILHAAVARRRLGELAGGAEGARMIAEVDALLAAQDIRAPERFARLYLPEAR